MKVRKWLCILLSLLLLLSLAGCGAKSMATDDGNMDYFSEGEKAPAENGSGLYGDGYDSPAPQSENRKWIITTHISAETEDMDVLLSQLEEQIEAAEGYVEDQNIHNGSAYSGHRRYRSADLTVRVPADRVEAFVTKMEDISNIVSSSTNRVDVTLSYADVESRLNALRAEEARLLELMAQAENMSDLLEIEGRLTDVRYQLESAASQLKLYDNQVDYATIYLSISEVQEYTPVEEKTVWQRIGEGFMDSLEGLWTILVELFVFVLAASPYLVVIAGIVVLIVFLAKKRRGKKRPPQAPKAPQIPNAPDTPEE